MLVFVEDENRQQCQPTCDTKSGILTQATLVGGNALTTAPSMLSATEQVVFLIYTMHMITHATKSYCLNQPKLTRPAHM